MYLPLSVFKILRSLGMREGESPGEFWFLNREAVAKAINASFPPTAFQCFETQIRWRTPIGQDAEKALRQYIDTQQAVNSSAINAAWGREMIWVNFAISEQKVNLKNHFCVLKKSKSFECIFTIVKFLKFS